MEKVREVPCSKCGLLRVVGGECRPCSNKRSSEYSKARYKIKSEEIKAKCNLYYANNREIAKARVMVRAKSHPEKIKKYLKDNSVKISERRAIYYSKNAEMLIRKAAVYAKNNPLIIKEYRSKNLEMFRLASKTWAKNNPEKRKMLDRKKIQEIVPSYVASNLRIPVSELSENEYKMHKAILQLKRTIKQAEKALNDTN